MGIQLQTGKIAIVTGGASGIGYHVSKELVAKNVHVVIGGKCKESGHRAIQEIRKYYPNAKVDFILLDLSSLQSVRDFAEEFLSRNLNLHILINNAGIMFPPYTVTQDGYESQLQVNYLSHFFLTQLLLDKMKQSGHFHDWARIVNVSSFMHYFGSPDLGQLGKRIENWYEYSSHKEYADSKLLVIAGAYMLDRHLQQEHACVSVCAVHPGVVQSNLWNSLHWSHRYLLKMVSIFYLSTKNGAHTTLFAALSTDLEGESGCYYDNSQKNRSASLTYDEKFQQELWTRSFLMIERAGH